MSMTAATSGCRSRRLDRGARIAHAETKLAPMAWSVWQLQTLNNPFGTIFNPFSINNAVARLHDSEFYQEEELITYHEEYISLDHHTSFDTRYIHQTLDKIGQFT